MDETKRERLPDKVTYMGFEIEPAPYKLANNKGWSLNINIIKHKAGGVVMRNFHAKNTYQEKEEAIKNCFIFGKQIIDGKYSGLSVIDM